MQIAFVLIVYMGISSRMIAVPHVLAMGKRDAWLCAIIAYLIILLWSALLFLIMRKNRQLAALPIWIKARAGGFISHVLMFVFTMFVFSISVITFYDFIQSVNIYFLPRTSPFIVMLPFLLMCAYSAFKGLKSIVYTAAVVLPIIWLLEIFLTLITFKQKEYAYLFPVLAEGFHPVIQGTMIALGGSAELLLLLLLQPYYKESFKWKDIALIVTIFAYILLNPILDALSSFGPAVASNMRFPTYEQWRLITLGEYISHIDFLKVFQLLCGQLVRLALSLFLLANMFKVYSESSRSLLKYAFWSILVGCMTLIPISDMWVQQAIRYYFYPASLMIGVVLTVILLIVSYLPQKKGSISP